MAASFLQKMFHLYGCVKETDILDGEQFSLFFTPIMHPDHPHFCSYSFEKYFAFMVKETDIFDDVPSFYKSSYQCCIQIFYKILKENFFNHVVIFLSARRESSCQF